MKNIKQNFLGVLNVKFIFDLSKNSFDRHNSDGNKIKNIIFNILKNFIVLTINI